MAFKPTVSAKMISARHLPDIVDRAVIAAAGDVKVAGPNVHVPRWDILGRRLRDMASAEKFADLVTAQVADKGFAVEPAVIRVNGTIIAGFIERDNLPTAMRGF